MVVGRRLALPFGQGRGDLLDVVLHARDDIGGLVLVGGGVAELLDLVVALVDRGRRGEEEGLDVGRLEAGHDVPHVVGEDDEVGLVPDDGLDVGFEAAEVGLGRLLRVVRLVVDGHDLVPGADGEQHLRGGGGQRDDPRRRRLGGGRGRGLVGGIAVVVVAAGGEGEHGERDGGQGQDPSGQWESSCRSRPRELADRALPDEPPFLEGVLRQGRRQNNLDDSVPSTAGGVTRRARLFCRRPSAELVQATWLVLRGGTTVAGQRRVLTGLRCQSAGAH